MFVAYIGITVVAILANASIAVADFLKARFVLDNSSSVGVPTTWLTPLGLLKAAGAVGLLLGLVGVPVIGTAAAAGLVLFFVGAILAHVRVGDVSLALGFPAGYLLLALGSLVLGLTVA